VTSHRSPKKMQNSKLTPDKNSPPINIRRGYNYRRFLSTNWFSQALPMLSITINYVGGIPTVGDRDFGFTLSLLH
jgi:hypothetical protein